MDKENNDEVHDHDKEDCEIFLPGKQKRQRESDTEANVSPPPKKPQQDRLDSSLLLDTIECESIFNQSSLPTQVNLASKSYTSDTTLIPESSVEECVHSDINPTLEDLSSEVDNILLQKSSEFNCRLSAESPKINPDQDEPVDSPKISPILGKDYSKIRKKEPANSGEFVLESDHQMLEPETVRELTSDSSQSVIPSEGFRMCKDRSLQNIHKLPPQKTSSSMSLPKSLSGVSLDQDLSISESLELDSSRTDSLDQDIVLTDNLNISWTKSGEFSREVFETDSLSSSLFLPDDDSNLDGDLSHVKTDNILDKSESDVLNAEAPRKKHSKDRHRRKRSKRGKNNATEAGGENKVKNLRPNYFVGIQITNADVSILTVVVIL